MGVGAVGTGSYLEGDKGRWGEMAGQETISTALDVHPSSPYQAQTCLPRAKRSPLSLTNQLSEVNEMFDTHSGQLSSHGTLGTCRVGQNWL